MSQPKVAVYKFSSCDGCQLSILNLEDELLDLAQAVDIAFFLERAAWSNQVLMISHLWKGQFQHHTRRSESRKFVGKPAT